MKCFEHYGINGDAMELTVSASENINGTLILTLFEGSESVPEKCQTGMSSSMKNQINRVLSNGDFKAKKKSTMTLYGGEEGKAILVGLGNLMTVLFMTIGMLEQQLLLQLKNHMEMR